MYKNYLVTAWRNIRHNKIISLINVLGLSTGICGALVIFLIVQHDFSFDRFEKDGDRIYRVVTNSQFGGNTLTLTGVPSPLPEAVKNEVTGLEETIGFQKSNTHPDVTISKNSAGKPSIFNSQEDVIFADKNYFKLIPYEWLAGSPERALNEPFHVVLTEQRAKIYFPSQDFADLIGKEIIFDDSVKTIVSGIVKNLSENTDLDFKEFISRSTITASGLKNGYAWDKWGYAPSSQLFIKLAAGSSATNIESQLKTLSKRYNKDDKSAIVYLLQPLHDIHFNSQYRVYGGHIANKPTLYSLLTVAAIILLLGCINFINLTTAQASERAMEIGVRKTMGGSRKQLVLQFLSETFFITIIATVLSALATPWVLRAFADFIPEDLHFDPLHQPDVLLFLVGLTVLVSFLSGFYPALVLSRYNPVTVLKNHGFSGLGGSQKAILRKSLTVSQFFIAQVFIMATVITVKQISYMLNKDLGFKKNAIISFSVPFRKINFSRPDGNRQVLLNEMKSMPGIQMLSLGYAPPSTAGTSAMTYTDEKKGIETEVRQKFGDTSYLKLFQIKILAGRNVEQCDTIKEYIINETFLHILGFQNPRDALNKKIDGYPIVGVMMDFNQESLQVPVKPLIFSSFTNSCYTFHVALKPQMAGHTSWKTTLGKIANAYKRIYPDAAFRYEFLDESIAKLYASEQHFSTLLKWTAGLAIFISCMGLLGMVTYTTQQRTREIGIRKVFGASVTHIVSIITRDFIVLILIAFVAAIPLAWWTMHKWLENFAFRTTMDWWLFPLCGFLMLIMAVITLGIKILKAAGANPVHSLRNE